MDSKGYINKKIFAVSDIHGHASIFKKALINSGFDQNNPEHLLIICGDCFDRGSENKELFEYLNGISNKVIIRGNHEEMLMNAIKRGYINYVDVYNGTEITIENLFGFNSIDKAGKISITDAQRKQIVDYLSQTVDCFETQNYVFVHGWIPQIEDWRSASNEEWRDARWMGWTEMHDKCMVKGKTIVCGHRASQYARAIDKTRTGNDYSPYYGGHFIAIDSNTVISKTVNVLVIEDEVLKCKMC